MSEGKVCKAISGGSDTTNHKATRYATKELVGDMMDDLLGDLFADPSDEKETEVKKLTHDDWIAVYRAWYDENNHNKAFCVSCFDYGDEVPTTCIMYDTKKLMSYDDG